MNWIGDQVDDATAAAKSVMDSVSSGDIMGAIGDAQAIAAEAAKRAGEAYEYTNDELMGPDDL